MDLMLDIDIKLPVPHANAGLPLMVALSRRRSWRQFSARQIPLPILSDLLWAANGVNRADSGGRTAPSAKAWREIDIFVAREDGLFRYDAVEHALKHVLARDVRAATGPQEFVADAPANLVYVADLEKVDATDPVERRFYCAANAGFIAQNVYLYCASEGLATVVRGLVDRRALARVMGLGNRQRVLLAQSIGFAA